MIQKNNVFSLGYRSCWFFERQVFVFFLTLLIMLASFFPSDVWGQGSLSKTKRVLVLHSYHKGFRWTDNLMRGIDSVFAAQDSLPIEVIVEYMDTKRVSLEGLTPALRSLFKLKYGNSQPDVILSSDDNALNFLLEQRDQIFPDVPIVFCGVNNFRDERIAGHTGITGIVEDFDLAATVELALSLHPQSKNLALITDSTPTGKINHQRFMAVAKPLLQGVDLIDLADLTTKELVQSLHALPEDTIIVNLSFFRDRAGKGYTTKEGNQLIVLESDKPVYSCWDFYLDTGVVGGKMVSGFSQGREAASRVMEILEGNPVEEIKILYNSPNECMFDYGPLRKAGLTVNELPQGSVILNQPQDFFTQHKTEILMTSTAFLLLSTALIIMGVNILQRRRAQKELAQTLGEFQSIFDNSQVGILMLRGGRKVYRANQRLADIFGYTSPVQFAGQSVRIFHKSDETFQHFGKQFFDTLSSGENVHIEYETLRKDGSPFWVLLSGKAVDNNIPPDLDKGVVWVMDDITERKHFQNELEKVNVQLEDRVQERTLELEVQTERLQSLNDRLQQLDKLKSAFLSTVSHDLRTPMTSIRGFAKLIYKDFKKIVCPSDKDDRTKAKLQERILANLTIIDQEGERLTRLINDVLDLTRIEAGHQSWNDQTFRIDDCVQNVVQSLQGQLSEKAGIHLQIDIVDSLPDIFADPDRIHQVLFNLLGNAVKFTDKGTVSIKVEKLAPGGIQVSVVDQGCGVPTQELDLIFDKFHQVERGNTLRDTLKGSGLGLAICKEIINHYGGEIWAQCEIDKGCTFFFTLPAQSSH